MCMFGESLEGVRQGGVMGRGEYGVWGWVDMGGGMIRHGV